MTTALYRRYRPDSFAEVIGQDHVTAPLRQALRSGQANHAYLFSGPRGCGKTTSARILARCLNCEQGPTDTPCGTCPSCVELARGGPGSLDVVEIDAASHGGVDDARELRERATFAPARDRYKIFILDEAHMVSNQGFNALLKIVEEPPPHIKFIFATTEPDKVIGTIRSRTHHYPFRLVPPDVLVPYLEQLCQAEQVQVGSGVLPLVVRAGAGSVRDTLSVLDQLIAGSGEQGLDYEGAVALLGYTHSSLLDDLVEAIAARDGASAFKVVDRVISTGHEPRRFVEDLLERLRDLIVIAASGDAASAALRDVPADQLARMRAQAQHLGAAELSRSADLANAALTEMSGATSPRLHLELLMARLLLPAADDTREGLAARLDRLERLDRGTPTGGAGAVPAATPAAGLSRPQPAPVEQPAPVPTPVPTPEPAEPASHVEVDPPAEPAPPVEVTPPARLAEPTPPVEVAPPAAPAAPAAASSGAVAADTEMLRRRWPEVLGTLKGLRLPAWALVNQHGQVLELDATTLRLGFAQPGLVSTFMGSRHHEALGRALRETLGLDVRVEGVLVEQGRGPATASEPPGDRGAAPAGPSADAASGSRAMSSAEAAASWDAPAARPAPAPAAPVAPSAPQGGSRGAAVPERGPQVTPPDDDEPPLAEPPDDDWHESGPPSPSERQPSAPGASGAPGAGAAPSARERAMAAVRRERSEQAATPPEEDDPSPDDPDITASGLVGAPLIAQMLGGTVIDEQLDDPA
ncbi:DNA polymerase III subunit gamma and tau [Cellulomonas soli]|uniref:DNA polymerase III subunit gamma and tau n=1 Tax=Cellulomonas soli TaxID=931535 RepID=UPI003F826D4F